MPRVALVTGAARGIGAATVRQLVLDGLAVVAVDICADDPTLPYPLGTEAQLQEMARLGAVSTVVGDVREAAVLDRAVSIAEGNYGGLDVAVAAAGVIAGGVPLWEMDGAQVQTVLEVDLHAVVALATATIPAMLRRPEPREGRFLAVASSASTQGLPMLAAYCAAKAGVTGLIRALAAELGGTGVTANAVSPGSTRTDILTESARLYDLPGREHFARQQALGRLLEPDEVAQVLAFVAGPGSSGMTGANVPVDGGLTL